MSDSVLNESQLEEFSLTPAIFIPFPSFKSKYGHENQPPQDLSKEPLLKLQKIISNLESQQAIVRGNMILLINKQAARLREVASKELSLAQSDKNTSSFNDQDQNTDGVQGTEGGYEELRTIYEKEMKQKEKEKEVDTLFTAVRAKAKPDCKSSDFKWESSTPKLTLTTQNIPAPAKSAVPGSTSRPPPTPNPTISPSPISSSSVSTFNPNDPLNLPATATSLPSTPTTVSSTEISNAENKDTPMPDAPPQQAETQTQSLAGPPVPRKKTPEEILAKLSKDLRDLVERSAHLISQYDIHAKQVVGVYKAALERRKGREGPVSSIASSSRSFLSNPSPGPGLFSGFGGVTRPTLTSGNVDTGNRRTGSRSGSARETGGNSGSAGEREVRRTSTGMPIVFDSGNAKDGTRGSGRVLESIEDIARRGWR